jgi:hypothetical protein
MARGQSNKHFAVVSLVGGLLLASSAVFFSPSTLVFPELGDTILHFAMNYNVIPNYLLEIPYFYFFLLLLSKRRRHKHW